MENPDFVALYFPDISELTDAQVSSARRRAELFLKKFDPTIDTRPNTPFGDLHLTNIARLLAAIEVAHGRFMSDLDLEQVASGIIWNCDFVRKYLQNFAVYDKETLSSSGVIRLTFCLDKAYTIDRRARYQFGDDVFELRLPHGGPLEVLPVGSTPPTNTNARVLTQVDNERYAIDVGVKGIMVTQVVAGTSGTTDFTMQDLTSIVAAYDFDFGTPPSSLAALAAKARETHYTASLTTAGGARNYTKRQFPDLKAASAVISGDVEMIRDVANPLSMGAGYLDMHVQSKGHAGTDSHYIKLQYYPMQGTTTVGRYIGVLDLVEYPQKIVSIVSTADATIDLGLGTQAIEIFSESLDEAYAPLAQASYSPNEKLWIAIDMPRTDLGAPRIVNDIDLDTGNESHRFLITYQADPMVSVVHDDLQSRNVKPVGVNVLVRGFVPVVIDDLLITYVKSPGVSIKLDAARDEIYNYFQGLGYPSIYSDSRVIDAMYYAGAEDVVSIRVNARVQWSVADWFLKTPGSNPPTSDIATTIANSVKAPTVTMMSSSGLTPLYQDELIGTASETFVSVGPKNVGYILDKTAIRFSETLRV
jgi:hypothetical protein